MGKEIFGFGKCGYFWLFLLLESKENRREEKGIRKIGRWGAVVGGGDPKSHFRSRTNGRTGVALPQSSSPILLP